jgi:cytochrome P450
MSAAMITSPTGLLLAAGAVALVVRWLVKFVKVRRSFRDLPCPPHNFFLGHIPVMARHQMKYPLRLHPHMYLLDVQMENNLPPVFYLDTWPVGPKMMVIIDPETAQEVTTTHSLPKAADIRPYIYPLSGKNNLVTMEGAEWKKWRAIFNPGFSAKHLTGLIPGMVDDVMTFNEILGEMADAQKLFRLEELATKLTFDIIGKVSV